MVVRIKGNKMDVKTASEFNLHPQLLTDCIELTDLPLCKLLLCNDSAYLWFILVPRIDEVSEIYQLEWQQQQQLLKESSLLAELLMQVFNGDKMNVAALGNVVQQLHVHHVIRYKTDVSWPKPVWGHQALTSYASEELAKLKEKLKDKLLPALENAFTSI